MPKTSTKAAARTKKLPLFVIDAPRDRWLGRCKMQEDVTDFFRRVWKPYLSEGLTLCHIRKVDPKLYHAIRNFSAVTGKDWPADIRVPTERTLLADALRRYREGERLTESELIAVGRRLAREDKSSRNT